MEKDKFIPTVDIFERENEYLIVAEMPGVSKENLDIEIEKDTLKIKGSPEWPKGDWTPIYREFSDQYEFERTFSLGGDIDRDKIKAKIENGILAVALPKGEHAKPKKIAIN